MRYSEARGVISALDSQNRYFRHFGGLDSDEAGTEFSVTIDLVFRMATNGITVTTEVNAEPLIITSAGQFR